MSSPPPGPNYSWQPQPGNYNSAPSKQLIAVLMQTQITSPTRLTTSILVAQPPTYVCRLAGTMKRTPASGTIVIQQFTPEPLCIRAFQVTM